MYKLNMPFFIKKKSKQTNQNKKLSSPLPTLQEAITELWKYWPELFPNGDVRPMQIGINQELEADCIIRQLPISKVRLKACLAKISNSLEYRNTFILGATRFNKDGKPSGVIDPPAVINAIQKTSQLRKKIKNKT